MAYTKQTWNDTSAGGTPVSAARLNYIESGIESAASVADTANSLAGTADTKATNADTKATNAQTTADAAVPKSVAAAKGDLVVATGPSTVVALPVAQNDRVLTTDSAATSGVKWGRRITTGSVAPTSPAVGDIWIKPA